MRPLHRSLHHGLFAIRVSRLRNLAAIGLGTLAATLLATLLLLLQPAQPGRAAEIPISASCTLVDAILAANQDQPVGGCPAGQGADTLILAADAHYVFFTDYQGTDTALPAIVSPITIQGNGATILRDPSLHCDENDAFRLLYVASTGQLTLLDTTIQHGCVLNAKGGGLYNAGGHVILDHSRILSNATWLSFAIDVENYGGGIYQVGASSWLTIKNSSVLAGNEAMLGGGMYISNGHVSLVNSRIEGNFASNASVLYSVGGQIRLRNSQILSNTDWTPNSTTIQQTQGASLLLDQSMIFGNMGGGISSLDSLLDINSSQIISNAGPAIQSDGANNVVTLKEQSRVIGNWTGILNTEGRINILDSQISDNYDSLATGLMNVRGQAVVRFSEISGNSGAGIWNQQGNVLIDNSQIVDNQDRGLLNNSNAQMEIRHSQIVSNSSSSQGAGIYNSFGGSIDGTSAMTITDSLIAYNHSNSNGGGIENDSSHLLIQRSQIISNTAGNDGGGLYDGPTYDDTRLTIEESQIVNNRADSLLKQGGALFLSVGERSTVVGSCIDGNSDTGVFTQLVAETIPALARDNWWGAANGPGGVGPGDGDSISTFVNFQPFLEACPLTFANLLVRITANESTARVGETIFYTYELVNGGGVPLATLHAEDDRLGTLVLDKTALGLGRTTSTTDSYTVQSTDPLGPLVNELTVTAIAANGEPVTATATLTVQVQLPVLLPLIQR